ncbi:hypothetical protein [Alicyclobacillus shizuokensis]|uniref:hypothetical protein n=1 Tax=Alicyclobacillus shizuokensis TaxID=392014 RepID=UPI000830715F|nr:hypothetical protein [Alicyclobacillus shizuokensis]
MSEMVHVESSDSAFATFLQEYVQSNMTQRVRLETTIEEYQSLRDYVAERIDDQINLIEQWQEQLNTGTGIATPDMLNVAQGRLQQDRDLQDEIDRILNDLNAHKHELSDRVHTYLMDLSKIEIHSGGFVAHIFGYNRDVQWDPDNSSLTFTAAGARAETAVSVPLSNWRDSSKFTIILKS